MQATPRGGGDVGTPASAVEPHRWPHGLWKRWALIVGVGIVVVLIVMPVVFTLQPGYYERYPSLAVRMANWRVSTHAKMQCSDCHVDPGFTGLATFAAKSIPDFYSQLVFGPKSTNLLSVPSTAACEKCHTTFRQVSPNGDLLIPHRAHVEVLQIRCAVCHKNLVHSLNPQGFNTPVMTTCMTCHDGKQATSECVKCHTQKEVPANHKASNWVDIHATKVGTIDCAECHAWTPEFCAACHKQRPASHAGNFKQTHPARIALLGVNSCYVCHDAQKFCKQCH